MPLYPADRFARRRVRANRRRTLCIRLPRLTRRLVICTFCLAVLPGAVAFGAKATVRFGSDTDYPPFEWREDGEAKGFNVELARAVAQSGGRTARHRSGSWAEIMKALESREVDVVPMFVTPRRRREFHFTDPFYFADTGVFAAPGAPEVNELAGLEQQPVAVEARSHTHQYIDRQRPEVTTLLTGNTLSALEAVVDGRVDYAIVNTLVAQHLIHRHELELEQKGPPLWSHPYAFAVLREREALADWLDRSYEKVVESGRFAEIRERWLDELSGTPRSWTEWLWPVGLTIGPIVALALVALAWNRMLRQRVIARTAELGVELERRREAEDSALYHARHESITGLPRRMYFLELADQCLADAGSGVGVDVVVVQLNNMGGVTRSFGHATSEAALQAFAKRLAGLGLPAIAHFGGPVFAAVVPDKGRAELVKALSRTLTLESVAFDPVVVAGIAACPEEACSASELLRRAETALARASGTRSTYVVYDAGMEPASGDLEIVREFRRDLGKGTHTVFQPQIALPDRACVGCEALVRWNHERLGPVSPAWFVPLLEEAGLIESLTHRMIDRAVAFAVVLRQQGRDCPVGVNLSIHDLLETELADTIHASLERHGGVPGDIKVEITETSFVEHIDRVSEGLQKLRAAGVRSSIDDFGTGYASLSYLSRFPVDEVKMDRMFVSDLCHNERHRAIVRATIRLAHDLGLIVVAEGVEDEETLAALAADECDRAQGYAIARPLDAEGMAGFLRTSDS